MTSALLVSFVVILAALYPGVSTGPVVEPVLQHVYLLGMAKVTCKFDAPLDDCRVRVWGTKWVDKVFDFGRGSASPAVAVNHTTRRQTWLTARYAGEGLANGECGVQLTGVMRGDYVVQCVGKINSRGYSSGFGLLTSHGNQPLATETPNPRFMLAERRSSVSVLLTAVGAVEVCWYSTPKQGSIRLPVGTSPDPEDRYLLHGAGPASGQCGITLPDVTEADAGLWTWHAWQRKKWASQMAILAIVAPPVGEPILRVPNDTWLHPGDAMTATCWTSPSVPPANITWLLGGEVIRADAWNATLDGQITALPWQPQPTNQTISHVLTSSDNGTWLECHVSHVALSSPQMSRVQLQLFEPGSEPEASQEASQETSTQA